MLTHGRGTLQPCAVTCEIVVFRGGAPRASLRWSRTAEPPQWRVQTKTVPAPDDGHPGANVGSPSERDAPDGTETEVVDARGRAPRAGRVALEAVAVGAAALLIVAWIYRIWNRSLSVPFENVFDARQVGASVKSIIEHGLFSTDTTLGAPFGKARFDWPLAGELLQRVGLLGLTLFSSRYGVVMNTYYLLGFAGVAIATFLVLRSLRFEFFVAGSIALVYSFLPFHLYHGEGHLLRSAAFSAPVAALVMLWALSFRSTLLHDPEVRSRSWAEVRANVRWRRVTLLVSLTALVALSETMTTFFTAIVLTIAALVVAIRDRSAAVLVPAAAVVVTLGVVYGMALLPNVFYWSEHGRNQSAVARIPTEQELYGLKLSQMVLPIPQHRLAAFRSLAGQAADRSPIPSEGGQQLGLLGAVGLLALLVGAVSRGVPYRARRPTEDREQLWRFSSLLSLILVLMGTISGFALLASLAGLTQVRTWNRVVVLVGFFALLMIGIGLERACRWLRRRWSFGVVLAPMLSVAVLGFALWDTDIPARFDQPAQIPTIEAVSGFVAQIEARLPAGAQMFQLPVIPYPEYRSRYARVYDYEALLPYLYSHDLAWSYGGIKGRPEADWQKQVDSANPVPSLAGLRGLGFDGIVLDTWQYDDGGVAATAALKSALGPPGVVGGEQARWRFWDLRDYGKRAGLSAAELRAAAKALVGRLIEQLPAPKSATEARDE